MSKKITVFAIIFLVISLFMCFSSISGLFNKGWMSMNTSDKQMQRMEKELQKSGISEEEIASLLKAVKESDEIDFKPIFILMIIVSLIGVIAGIGLLKLKNWARITSIVLLGMVCLPAILMLITIIISAGISGNPPIIIIPFLIICFVSSIIFLTRSKVKEQFN